MGLAGEDLLVREQTTTAHGFDPAEIHRSKHAEVPPPVLLAALPLAVVVAVNLLMSFVVLPRMDTAFLAEPRWGATSLLAVGGVPLGAGDQEQASNRCELLASRALVVSVAEEP